MTSKELKIARNRIDKVDKALFKLIKKRTKIVRPIRVQMKNCTYRILDCYTQTSLMKLVGFF